MHVLNREFEPAMPHGLESQVRKIQAEAYLRTGRSLTTEQALAELDNPTKRPDWKAQVRSILAHGCYGPRIGEHVFALIEHDGTVLGDLQLEKALTQDDLHAIEACLPGTSAWHWSAEFGGVFGDERFAGSAMVGGLAVRGKVAGDGTWG